MTKNIDKDIQNLLNKLKKKAEKLKTEQIKIEAELNEVNKLIENLMSSKGKEEPKRKKQAPHVKLTQEVIDEIEQLFLKGFNRKEVKEQLSVDLLYITVANRYNRIQKEYELAKIYNLDVEKIREIKQLFKNKKLDEKLLWKIKNLSGVSEDVITKLYEFYRR